MEKYYEERAKEAPFNVLVIVACFLLTIVLLIVAACLKP